MNSLVDDWTPKAIEILSDTSGFINTWLEPGEMRQATVWKPFKRFPVSQTLPITRLKPGVNENFDVLFLGYQRVWGKQLFKRGPITFFQNCSLYNQEQWRAASLYITFVRLGRMSDF